MPFMAPISLCMRYVPVMFGPNITGTYRSMNCMKMVETSGAIYKSGDSYVDNAPTVLETGGLALDASLSSAIYGRSQTVQPNSLQLLPCIRV